DPTASDELVEGVLESGGRGHAAVVGAPGALRVAHAVERHERVFAEFCGFAQYRPDQVWRGIGESREIRVALDVKHVVEQKHHVVDGRLVDRHGLSFLGYQDCVDSGGTRFVPRGGAIANRRRSDRYMTPQAY